MAVIRLVTRIHAPPERCFDLSRSIDLHTHSAKGTDEQAIAGVRSGLIGLGQQVTWRARHFGLWHHLTVEIDVFDRPNHFRDRMIRGPFKSMRHDHWFKADGEFTLMTDLFAFELPLGAIGRLANRVFLRDYLEHFLTERNDVIKRAAESNLWRQFLFHS
jgi:ligand-binding SRPBCC domain-containing protein